VDKARDLPIVHHPGTAYWLHYRGDIVFPNSQCDDGSFQLHGGKLSQKGIFTYYYLIVMVSLLLLTDSNSE
jgi:hypothetical protein